MKHIALFAQIATLTMAALSRRPDAMGWAAGFAVLCVVVVLVKRNRIMSTEFHSKTKPSRPNVMATFHRRRS